MAVPAPYNDFLSHSWNQPGQAVRTTYYYNSNGTYYAAPQTFFSTMFGGASWRNPHEKSSYQLTNGVTFRPPTNYGRYVFRVKNIQDGKWRVPKFGGQYQIIEGNFGYSSSLFYSWCLLPPWTSTACLTQTNAENQAITECLLKLREGKMSLLEDLGESVRTANALANSVSSLCRALIAFREGNWAQVARQLGVNSRGLANGYLAWKFGWEPLCGDIYNGVQLLRGKLNSPPLLRAVREIKTKINVTSSHPTSDLISVTGNYTSIVNKCILYARIDDANLHLASSIGVNDPLGLAWEFVPWSFVVDWVLPVGNILSALTATQGLTFVAGVKIQRAQGHGKAEKGLQSGDNVVTAQTLKSQIIEFEMFHTSRVKLLSFPWPKPYVKSPFSTTHALEALALLKQLL